MRDRRPYVYVDGEQIFTGRRRVPDDDPDHTFNIGAGLDDGGWLGYNFKGKIASVLAFDKALEPRDINAFAQGDNPSAKPAMLWPNK